MTNESDSDRRRDELLSKLFDEQLTLEESQELSEMLRDGRLNTDDFTDELSIHAAIAWHEVSPRSFSSEELRMIRSKHRESQSSPSDSLPSAESSSSGPRLRTWLSLILATAATLIVAFTVTWSPEEPQERKLVVGRGDSNSQEIGSSAENEQTAGVVAQIVDAVGTNMTAGLEMAKDRTIFADQTLEIESGLVELQFLCGADAVLAGPARLRILGPKEVALDIGKITVRMQEGVDGFLVHTPDGRIKDLGTAFGVEVSGKNASQVSVFDGAVDVTSSGNSKEPLKVSAGEAVRLNRDGSLDKLDPVLSLKDVRDFSLNQPSYVLAASKDAFVRGGSMEGLGEDRNYGDDTELHVKLDTTDINYTRRAWLGFDLTNIPKDEIIGARLTLTILPNRLAEIAEPTNIEEDTNWLFEISGLWDIYDSPWDEYAVTWANAPGNAPMAVSGHLKGPEAPTTLGSFSVRSRGKLGDKVQISGPELLEFLRSDRDEEVTLIVSRRSGLILGTNDDRVVHGFASREHPDLDPPTLELWCDAQPELAGASKSAK